jgi:hypothetical protein
LELAEANRELPTIIHVADILACRAQLGFSATAAAEEFSDDMLDVIHVTRESVDEITEQLEEQVSLAETIFRQ